MEDIVYLEVDSEITEAIDQLKSAKGHTIKLVVPARSGLLSSAVNLKLLKKAATDSSKELALVTSDKTARNMAGRIGIAVAANVKAEPKVPELPTEAESSPDIDEAKEIAASAAAAAATKAKPKDKAKTPLDADDGSESPESESEEGDDATVDHGFKTRALAEDDDNAEAAASPADKASKSKSDKTSNIPDFGKFQKRLFIALGAIVGLIVIILLLNFLPSSLVTVMVKADKKSVNINFTADASQNSADLANSVIAAKKLTESKNVTSNFSATGSKDVGTPASGTITLNNKQSSAPVTVPSGSVLTASGLTFTLNNNATIPGATVSGGSAVAGSVNAAITATAAGAQYNLSDVQYSIAGQPSLIYGAGDTNGGTTKTVTIVAQSDIDAAKQQLSASNANQIQQDLESKAGSDATVFSDTYTQSVTNFASSVAAGAQASSGTVSATVEYSMLTAPNSQLDALFNQQIKGDISANDDIYQNGRDNATFKMTKQASGDIASINATSTAYIGPTIDKAALAKLVAGKSRKGVAAVIQPKYAFVQDAQATGVLFWPWLPLQASHIKIKIQVITD